MFSYTKIIKQAFELIRTHKFLWVFGFFLVLGQGLDWLAYNLERRSDQSQTLEQQLAWIGSNLFTALIATLILLIVIILLGLITSYGQSATIVSVRRILDKQEVGLKNGLKNGKFFYLRIFVTTIVVSALMLAVLVVLGVPILYLFFSGLEERALVLGLIALFIFFPVSIFLKFTMLITPNFIVLHDLKIWEAIKASVDLVKIQWFKMFLFSFVVGAASVLALFLGLIASWVLSVLFVQMLPLFYDLVGELSAEVRNIIGFVLSAVILLVISSGVWVFWQIAWVLFFMELVKPQKFSEVLEREVLPEVIGN